MAVTPSEAAKINDAAEVKAIKEMEAHIDGCLNKSFRTGMSVSIGIGEITKAAGNGYSKRAWEVVRERFESAGWEIKKKRTKERYNMESNSYLFSASAVAPPYAYGGSGSAPTQWDVDNEGKDQSQIR